MTLLIDKDLKEAPTTSLPLWRLEQQTADILDEAVRLHKPVQIACLMSGGHDSVAATVAAAQWAVDRKHPFTVLHLDTGIGIAQTQDYVQSVCAEQAWDLQIYRARENVQADGTPDPMLYENLVRYHGFPSNTSHSIMYTRLKERSLHRFVRSVKQRRSDRVMFVSGVRKSESAPRMRQLSDPG